MYRPLYKAEWLIPAQAVVRPLVMFNENVLIDGKYVPRFKKIEDDKLNAELKKVRDELYAN